MSPKPIFHFRPIKFFTLMEKYQSSLFSMKVEIFCTVFNVMYRERKNFWYIFWEGGVGGNNAYELMELGAWVIHKCLGNATTGLRKLLKKKPKVTILWLMPNLYWMELHNYRWRAQEMKIEIITLHLRLCNAIRKAAAHMYVSILCAECCIKEYNNDTK